MFQGDFHDEIDIVGLDVTGQHFNLTFAADMSNWNHTHSAIIILHPDFKGLEQEPTYPYYTVLYQNHSMFGYEGLDFHVFFTYVTGPSTEQYWNETTGWVSSAFSASDIGYASDKSIIADVPTEAYTIPDDIDCIAVSTYFIAFFLVRMFMNI